MARGGFVATRHALGMVGSCDMGNAAMAMVYRKITCQARKWPRILKNPWKNPAVGGELPGVLANYLMVFGCW